MTSTKTILPPKLQGPPGLHWLWRLVYGHGFWGGLMSLFCMSPILMLLLIAVTTRDLPSWQEQYKSFIIGDPLLAIIGGILAILVRKNNQKAYTPTKHYWKWWICAGLAGSVLFISNTIRKGELAISSLLQPHLLYHHILLITTVVALLGGMGYIQYRRHSRDILWILILALLLGFISLVTLDTIHPPLNA